MTESNVIDLAGREAGRDELTSLLRNGARTLIARVLEAEVAFENFEYRIAASFRSHTRKCRLRSCQTFGKAYAVTRDFCRFASILIPMIPNDGTRSCAREIAISFF